MKALRISLLALLGLVLIALLGATLFVATFDANRYKPELEKLVFDQTGRSLKIDGNISLTLFPNIGAELGRTTLSEKDSQQAFVTIESSRVSVALMPILSGQVLVDGIAIDGLSANVTRDKGGALNFADLMGTSEISPQKPSQTTNQTTSQTQSFQFDIGSIGLTNASLTYTDLQNNTDLKLSSLTLKTGQIAPRSSGKLELSGGAQSKSLSLDTQFDVNSNYKLDLPGQKFDLGELSAKLTGNWQDAKSIDATVSFDVTGELASSKDSRAAAYTITNLKTGFKADVAGQATEIAASTTKSTVKIATSNGATSVAMDPAALTLALKDPVRQITSELKLPAFNFVNDQLDLKQLAVNVSVTDPALGKTPLAISAGGDLSLNTKVQTVNTQLAGKFDGSPIKATAGVADFSQPAITFDVALDELKLDRFGAGAGNATQAGTGDGSGSATAGSGSATAASIDLSGLKGHNVKGKLRLGKVLSKGLTIDQVQADVALRQGKLSVAPHSAQLFGGKLTGSLTVDANNNQFTLKENITGIKLDSLLAALGQDPKVTGQGALALDLTTAGNSVKALEQNLAGKANINLRDGAVKGIDIGAIINNVRGMLGKAPTQQGTGSGETTFTELTASATIAKGIATNRDLNVKAPLFRLEGAGTVNIPNSTLDYLAKVAVVETSTGQGGKDLAALRGVTIPIKISGQFDSPKYNVDVASLAAELAKSQLGDKAKDEINKVVPGLGDALKGLFGR